MFEKKTLFYTNAHGKRIRLARRADGSYAAKDAAATLYVQTLDGCEILYASAALQKGAFDADTALTVRLPDRKVPFAADAMKGEFWCQARFGGSFTEVPPRTQALLWRERETWHLLWPRYCSCSATGGSDTYQRHPMIWDFCSSCLRYMPQPNLPSGTNLSYAPSE